MNSRPVAAVAVEEQQDFRVGPRGRDAGPDRAAIAAPRLDHDPRAGLPRPFGGAVARTAVDHDHLGDALRQHVAHHRADRLLLIEAWDDGGDDRADIVRSHTASR